MATWSVTVNKLMNESSADDRMKQVFVLIENTLFDHSGWKLIGYGDGSTFSKNASGITPNPFPAHPSITGAGNDSWVVFENTDGVQLIFQVHNSYFYMYWSVDGDYLAESTGPWDDATATVRPGSSTALSDEVAPTADNIYPDSDFYMSIATSGDGNSFIAFSGYNEIMCMALVKLENTKPLNDHPYWSYLNSGSGIYDDGEISSTSSYQHGAAYHPVAGDLLYILSRLRGNGEIMDSMPADPYSGNEQVVEAVCICEKSPYKHMQGKVPGFVRNSSNRGLGDTFDGGEYMCMGEWALPWDGTTTPLL